VQVHSHAADSSKTARQDINTHTASQHADATAACNYAYLDDYDDIVPEQYHDWPDGQCARPHSTRNGLEVSYENPTVADAHWRPPASREPLSVISGQLCSNAVVDYNRVGAGAYGANAQRCLNDASV